MLTNGNFSTETLRHLVILILGNLQKMGLISPANYANYERLNLKNPKEAIAALSNDLKTLPYKCKKQFAKNI